MTAQDPEEFLALLSGDKGDAYIYRPSATSRGISIDYDPTADLKTTAPSRRFSWQGQGWSSVYFQDVPRRTVA